MPVLNWIGKNVIINHHKDVPFRFLKRNDSKSMGNSDNLLIEGDNLEALKSLLPYYKGKIKCIYIDPPYNTGNENWVYNDNVNSPKIKKWLGKVVGSEGEDMSRHDKWLCMMYPRLKLLKELLSDDGLIFISINDNEIEYLKILMNEIFDKNNFRNNIVIKRGTSNIQSQFTTVQKIKGGYESVLLYSKNFSYKIPKPLKEDEEEKDGMWNNHWRSTDRPTLRYELFGIIPSKGTWRWSKKRSLTAIENYKTMVKELKKNGLQLIQKNIDLWYLKNINHWDSDKIDLLRLSKTGKPEHFVPPNRPELITDVWLDLNSNGSRKLKTLLPDINFDNPKSVMLLKRILGINLEKNDIVLDSFAGSGTTGHAVMELNKQDNGNRKFILIELEPKIAKNITAKRLSHMIKSIGGGGGAENIGFTYCTLGNELFDKDGKIDPNCTFYQLANYIFFTETRQPLEKLKTSGVFIGESKNVEIYLIFHGIGKKNIFDYSTLKSLPKNTKKIVYADSCSIVKHRLNQFNITFKQIPYEVKIF